MGLGVLRLTPYDLYNMSFSEFSNMMNGFLEYQEGKTKEAWEQTRWHAAVCANFSGNIKKGKSVKPTDLIRFSWDEGGAVSGNINATVLKQIDDMFPDRLPDKVNIIHL